MVLGRRPGALGGPQVNAKRIRPANLADLPSVLDARQASNVLRVSIERVRDLADEGILRRLTYSRQLLFAADELERFLYASTRKEGDPHA